MAHRARGCSEAARALKRVGRRSLAAAVALEVAAIAAAAPEAPPTPAPVDAVADDEPPPPSTGARGLDESYVPVNREPRLVHSEPPQYPKQYAGTGVTAEVTVAMIVDRQGRASHIRVEASPDADFTAAALDALAKWEYLPAIEGGRVVNAPMEITVLVAEELGDSTYFDYRGGRISLEGSRYAGEHDRPVRRLRSVRPVYPFDLLAARKPGEVVVEFDIADDGVPRGVIFLEATHDLFAHAVHGAVANWHYAPAMSMGRSVPVRLRYRVSFQPDELDERLVQLAADLQAGRPNARVAAPKDVQEQPRVVRMLQPARPEGEIRARRHRVTVDLVVNEKGEVELPRVVSVNEPLVDYLALTAVGYWRFTPGTMGGKPVSVAVTLPVVF